MQKISTVPFCTSQSLRWSLMKHPKNSERKGHGDLAQQRLFVAVGRVFPLHPPPSATPGTAVMTRVLWNYTGGARCHSSSVQRGACRNTGAASAGPGDSLLRTGYLGWAPSPWFTQLLPPLLAGDGVTCSE